MVLHLWRFLPVPVIDSFQREVKACGMVTSGDIIPLGDHAKKLMRLHHLDKGRAAEEFYKLALDCGLEEMRLDPSVTG